MAKTELSPQERDFLEYIDMGMPSQKDMAHVLGIGSAGVSQIKTHIRMKNPAEEVIFYTKVDQALELRRDGWVKWTKIAKQLGYNSTNAALNAVKYRVRKEQLKLKDNENTNNPY